MNELTKVIRLEIVKPVNSDWKTVGPRLREVQRMTAEALNFCIRRYYLEAAEKLENLKKERIKPKRSLLGVGNSYCKLLGEKYQDKIPSYVYSAISNIARQRFDKDWFNILVKGSMSLPSYRNDCPIYIARIGQYGVQIREDEDDKGKNRYLRLQISPKVGQRAEITEFVLHNSCFDESRSAIWDRLIQGQYKLRSVQLLYKKRLKKWFANISYRFEPEVAIGLDPNTRVGVDLGLSVPVYLALNNGFGRAALREEGDSIQSFRRQLDNRRRRLRRNERGILERRTGHGKQHKIGSIEKLRELENNFRRTANHRLSRAVINFSLKYHAGVIVVENLKHFYDEKCEDSFLKTWTYHELQTMIEQKAQEVGITVQKVDPHYTSQRCSKCGHIDPKNRNGRDFQCVQCGYQCQADFNAARNLAKPHIEAIIKSSLKAEKSEVNQGNCSP